MATLSKSFIVKNGLAVSDGTTVTEVIDNSGKFVVAPDAATSATTFFATPNGNVNLFAGTGSGDTITIGGASSTVSVSNLNVSGTVTTTNATTIQVDDPVITIGGDTAPPSDDNLDRGVEFRYHNGTSAKRGFFGFDDSTGKFTFIPDVTSAEGTQAFTGTLGTVDVAAVHINGSQIAASNLSNGTTGSGSVVLATSPSLTTPSLGVATATSVNKVAITAPATSATLTIADGKTLTASNTITLSGTDSSTLNIGAGGTLASMAYQAGSSVTITGGSINNTTIGATTATTGRFTTVTSTQATGTAPFTVASTTAVTNLNADLLDGQHGSYYSDWTNITNKPDPVITVTLTGDVTGTANTTLTDLASGTVSVATTIGTKTITINGSAISLGGSVTTPNWYPTTFAWTGGTTAGPTGSLTGSGMSAVSFGAIPEASLTASGIITTGTQSIIGNKTLQGQFTISSSIATADKIILSANAKASGTSYMSFFVPGTLTGNRTYELPDVTGILVTTGDTGTVTNTMLAGSIATSKITGLAASATTDTTNANNITSGTLSVARGGTGAGTLAGIVKGNGTSALTTAVAGTDYAAPDQTMYIGTTAVAINRATASLALTGITSIDGSAATLTTSRTLTIGSTGKTFNGSADVSWTLAEIGAAATNQTMYIGTTAVAINRASAAIALTGITSIDGNAATVTNGVYTTGSYSNPSWITSLADTKVLPSQTSNSGKFLTTNGTSTSWATVDALPSQTGNSGKYLTTNGTSASWATISAGATLSSVAASTTYYIGLSSATSGSWTDARVDSTNLYFDTTDNTLFATNFNTSSDERLKTEIHVIEDALKTVNKLNGVGFRWKENNQKTYGVIAQNVEAIIPELVKENDGRKSVNYNALIGFLIEAVKELNGKLESLKNGA